MPRVYNFIYSKIVQGDDDFVGQIAYSLYKKDKIKFIEKFKTEHTGKDPDDADLKSFYDLTSMETFVETYRLKAESILDAFMNTTLDEAIQGIEQDAIDNHKQVLESIIEPIKPHSTLKQLFLGTMEHFSATILFSAILTLFIVISFAESIGFRGAVQNIFHVKIEDDNKPAQSDTAQYPIQKH